MSGVEDRGIAPREIIGDLNSWRRRSPLLGAGLGVDRSRLLGLRLRSVLSPKSEFYSMLWKPVMPVHPLSSTPPQHVVDFDVDGCLRALH